MTERTLEQVEKMNADHLEEAKSVIPGWCVDEICKNPLKYKVFGMALLSEIERLETALKTQNPNGGGE